MIEDEFDGSLVLEMLAEVGLREDFYEAIDSDNVAKAVSIMRRAQIDEDTIEMILKKIQEANT